MVVAHGAILIDPVFRGCPNPHLRSKPVRLDSDYSIRDACSYFVHRLILTRNNGVNPDRVAEREQSSSSPRNNMELCRLNSSLIVR